MISKVFFPASNPSVQALSVWGIFAGDLRGQEGGGHLIRLHHHVHLSLTSCGGVKDFFCTDPCPQFALFICIMTEDPRPAVHWRYSLANLLLPTGSWCWCH